MMMASTPDSTSLFFKRNAGVGHRKITVRLQHRPERTDVAQYVAGAVSECLAGDAAGRVIDAAHLVRLTVARQPDAGGAEGVGDQTIRAGLRVAALEFQDPVGMRQVPQFAAPALLQTGEHELGAHGSVTNKTAFPQDFQQWFLHNPISTGFTSAMSFQAISFAAASHGQLGTCTNANLTLAPRGTSGKTYQGWGEGLLKICSGNAPPHPGPLLHFAEERESEAIHHGAGVALRPSFTYPTCASSKGANRQPRTK
jgi:hypothetical protein